ncbi:MAG TPA: ABC transporter permease subunit [Chloroflexota bacterium]|nr:ABC transporter permease subunit [Chloroflexota bacterium]HUM67263.1 ABC transporter permease subunit [Chloroflexota bacterium]
MKQKAHFFLVAAILAGVVAPLLPLLIWAFVHRWFFPDVLPATWSGRAWIYLLSGSSQMGRALFNSVTVALAVTLLSLLIALPAARALALYPFRGKTAVLFFILAPALMPVIAVVMGMHVAFLRLGLADSRLGVILAHLVPVLPYLVLVLTAAFANYNLDYEGQARVLGARPYQVFRHVTLPAIWPGLMVGCLFAFLISWSQYLLTLIIGGGQVLTLPVLLLTFASSGDNTITAALSLVFITPALLLFLLTARYLTGRHTAVGGFGKL